ncbi:MAG: SDR family oxidoreductase [Flaviflexus sp.]|nr:SDR family oxidoreductase [Flaviflexus sp.]
MKTAIITGASRGLGREFALTLARAGIKNLMLAGRDEQWLSETTRLVQAEADLGVATHLGDLTRREVCDELVAATLAEFGQIDVLVNNAGACIHGDALDVQDEEWHHVIDVNLNAVWMMCQSVGREMVEAGSGSIINIGSMSGMIVNRPQWQPAYNASKAAVHHLTRSLAAEWGPLGVRVNAIAPGYMKTDMSPVDEPRFQRHWIDDAPMKRYGVPSELSGVLIYLASEASSFVTGSVITVDGGYTVF